MDALIYQGECLQLLDQRQLPHRKTYLDCRDHRDVAQAIRQLGVRGAPAIGIAAALGVFLGARQIRTRDPVRFLAEIEEICQILRATRPTAVNLSWALDRIERRLRSSREESVEALKRLIEAEALRIWEEEREANRAIGELGKELIRNEDKILTHCNTGSLATGGTGTALGIILAAFRDGKRIEVWVDETRPILQGARLTAWELAQEGVPARLITDSMAGHFMRHGAVDLVLVGADRIAANGDVANKIGTYPLAVLSREHNIPFYVAAPTSTFDLSLACGDEIRIEERDPQEVTHFLGWRIAPEGTAAANPAFDVTPHRYIRAIITERGRIVPPLGPNLRAIIGGKKPLTAPPWG